MTSVHDDEGVLHVDEPEEIAHLLVGGSQAQAPTPVLQPVADVDQRRETGAVHERDGAEVHREVLTVMAAAVIAFTRGRALEMSSSPDAATRPGAVAGSRTIKAKGAPSSASGAVVPRQAAEPLWSEGLHRIPAASVAHGPTGHRVG